MKNHANNKKAYFSIKQTIALTFVAMAGLLAGYYFLLGGTRVFHEIKYQPKVILDSILSDDSVQVDPLLSKCINDPKCNNDSLEKIRCFTRSGTGDTCSKRFLIPTWAGNFSITSYLSM